MAENADAQRAKPKSIGSELIIPVAALFFTLYYFYTIIDAPWTAQVAAFIVGSILILLVVLILIKSVRSLGTGEGTLDFSNLVKPKAYVPKRLSLLALTIAYIFIVPSLGFTITTFLFLSLAMLILSDWRKKRFIISLSATLSLGGYLLFIVAFKTRFPAGPFETFMKGFL
tara:strand:- start:1854 stop:2366 length:513 start_codon:yes stop_codon:yes gene_type:complete